MNKDTDNVSLSNNTRISVCFSILIISIIILTFCDKDVLCYLVTPVYTVIFVSISYLFLETKKCKTTDKSGGFVDKKELFNYTRDDIEEEKIKLSNQNDDIANILNKFDGFERYNGSSPNSTVINKGLNDLSMEELQEEATDLLRVTRTDFIPLGLKKMLLSKINDILSFSEILITKISKSNSWTPDDNMFNHNFIDIVKKAYLDSNKGRSYINSNNISERFLNEDYILNHGIASGVKANINMLEKNVIFNDVILSQCCKLLYCMLPREQIIAPDLICTDYYFSGKLMSESDDESLEKNILLHSEIVKFFESLLVKNFNSISEPSISPIKCNVQKTGSAELTPEESRKLELLKEMEFLGLSKDQQNTMDTLLKKQGKSTNKLTAREERELTILSGKDRFGLDAEEKRILDALLIKQGNPPLYNKKSTTSTTTSTTTSKKPPTTPSKPPSKTTMGNVEVISKKADSKTTSSIKPQVDKKDSKYKNPPTSKKSPPDTGDMKAEAKEISTVESIKEIVNISEDNFKNGIASNERILLEDKLISNNEGKSILLQYANSKADEVSVFSRNLILRRPFVLLLNKDFDGDKTNPFDGQLQDKKYNEFRDKIYKLYMYNLNDLHLRFMAHFISNKQRLSELTSIDDKCLERINKIGKKVKILEEEIMSVSDMKKELEELRIIAKETNKLRGETFELQAKLDAATKGKGDMTTKGKVAWTSAQELELQDALDDKAKLEEEVKELKMKNSELLISEVESRAANDKKILKLTEEKERLETRIQSTNDKNVLLGRENKDQEMEISKMQRQIRDLNGRLEYLTERENRIIAETKFSQNILTSINNSKFDVRKLTDILRKLKEIVVSKYSSHKNNLSDINKKASGTVKKLEQKIVDISSLITKINSIHSNYNKNTVKGDTEISQYKTKISQLNLQMSEVKRLLKPFFITNGTGFEYLKQHLENLNNEKQLIKEELSKINFSILSKNVKNNTSEDNEPEYVGNTGRFIVNSNDSNGDSEKTNFAEFVGKYSNELDISKRIKLFKRLQEIDMELYKQYNLIERYNQFVDKIFNEFKKVDIPDNKSILINNEFLKEYEFLALNYRKYILDYKKIEDLNKILVSKNNILSKRINELSSENKILSTTISSKEPDKLIVNMKDEIVRLNNDIEKYYKNNSGIVQDLEELKISLQRSMEENSQLKDTILELEMNMDLMKKEYKKNLESAIDIYAVELNNDLDTMVILLNGSNNVEWDTNNAEISNTKKKQLFIISKIKELLLSKGNSKKNKVELEDVNKKLSSLNEKAKLKNNIIAELRESISSGKEFINSSGVMSSSNLFKTNSELYEEEKKNMQENIKLLEDDKKRILKDLEYTQETIEKSNKESKEVNGNVTIVLKNIAKASDYMSTPLGFHTKNALTELFKCISSNSIKRILFHKIFKGFFTKEFAKEFSIQEDLKLNVTNLGDVNIFTEEALVEIYDYTTEDGKETNVYTDNFSNYLKKINSSKLEDSDINNEKQGKAESEEDEFDYDTVEYVDYETEPDRWDYNDDEEYKQALDLFNKKKENKGKGVEANTATGNDVANTVVVNTVVDTVSEIVENMDAKLIILLILDKLNVINKESDYYKNTISPLFDKYKIRENSFNNESFLKECFNNVSEDTDNYINKIRNLDLIPGKMTKSIVENSDHNTEKINSLLSLEKYIDEVMDEKDMINNLYSLDKYENIEMDYLIAINILDIKNYDTISKYVKTINSKLGDVKFMLNDVGNDLINSIIPKASNLNKSYFSVIDSLKSILFTDKSRANSFIERELKKISKNKDYNKFDEVQAIILSELNKKFISLGERLKECEDSMNSGEKLDSDLFKTKGLLQVYQDGISEISKRFNLYSSDVKEITTTISNNINKIQTNKDKLNVANSEVSKLKDANDKLKKELDILYGREDDNLKEIGSLNKSLENINSAISTLKNKKANTNKSITSLDKEIESSTIKIQEYDRYIQSLTQKVNELSAKEIGRNKINEDIKKFIIDMTPEIKDDIVLNRLNYIKKSLDENINTIKEKEDEKEALTNLNNQLTTDRDRIVSDVNKLLNESITSDDKEWMNGMDEIGIKLDIINKFIEKWESNGNEKIRSLIELLKNNKDVSMNTIGKINSNIADIADIDFIIQKIKPYIKKPEDLAVKYNSELLEHRDELKKVEDQKGLLEIQVSKYVSERREKIIYLNDLDSKLRKYISENNLIKDDISSISIKYNQLVKVKKEFEETVRKMETEINSKNIEILSLGEEISKHKETILEMTRKIDLLETSSRSKIDKKQCSDYVEGIIDSIVKVMIDKVSSINDITKVVEIISNRWSKGNLDISKYIEKNKILEEEIKKLSKMNIDYEKSIANFKKNEEMLKQLTMVFQLFANKSDKTILQKLKLKDLRPITNSEELERYLNAKINLSSEIIKGFVSVVENYESIQNILKDTKLIVNIKYIISKCNEYKNILARRNMEEISNVNELLLTKDELAEKIKTTEAEISLLIEEKNRKVSEEKSKLRSGEYVSSVLNTTDTNAYLNKYKEDIEYVQNTLIELESIIKKDNIVNDFESFKSRLLRVVNIGKKILDGGSKQLNDAYENISEENIVNLNPLVQNLLRTFINKNKEELLEEKKKELTESVTAYNKDITKEITTINSSFDKNTTNLYEKLDIYKLLYLKASGQMNVHINDINKSSEIIEILKGKISNVNSDIEKNKKDIDKILKDKQKAIEINEKLKSIETITIDTANTLQKNIDGYNRDIVEIKIYLGSIVNDTKILKENHSKVIEDLLLSKDKSEIEKKEALDKYNKSLEIIETTNKALKQCDDMNKQYRINRDLSLQQLNTDLVEAKKLLDYQLINLNSFAGVVKKSIDSVYKSVQEINIISAMTGEIKENINRKLAIKEDGDIINTAVKNKEIYEKIIKEFKSPIERQILKNKLLAIELNSVKSKIDIISRNYKSSPRINYNNVTKNIVKEDIRVVEEFIYVDRNNNIILPNSIAISNAKKIKEPATDYDKYRKQLVKQ